MFQFLKPDENLGNGMKNPMYSILFMVHKRGHQISHFPKADENANEMLKKQISV